MRLIDADALRADAITRSGGTEFAFDNCYPFWQFSQAIAQAPTVEAVVLPCKIGDEFWTELVGIRSVKCSMLTQKADGSWQGRFTVAASGGAGITVSLGEIEKRLFRTRAEAEAALAKMKGGANNA